MVGHVYQITRRHIPEDGNMIYRSLVR